MRVKKLHKWNLSYAQAVDLQKRLACRVRFTPLKKPPKLIAGLDCAFTKDSQNIVACVVVLKTLHCPIASESFVIPAKAGIHFQLIETKSAVRKVTIPYIPGLLSFREAPVCIAAVERLKNEPDLFIIDGQGIAHPRRLGLAAHLGLFFDKPTIGCAKSRLTGTFEDPPLQKGAYTLLKDTKKPNLHTKYEMRDTKYEIRDTKYEAIGAVVRTRTNVKPVFVSVGNRCRLKDAVKMTLACTTKYRLPEPTRLAHQLVSKLKLNV